MMRKGFFLTLIIAIAVFIFPFAVMADVDQRAGPSANVVAITGDLGQITATHMTRVVTSVGCTIAAIAAEPINNSSTTMAKITLAKTATIQRQVTFTIEVVTVPEPQYFLVNLVNAINGQTVSSLFVVVALVNTRTVAVNYGGPGNKFIPSSMSVMADNLAYLRTDLGHLRI